MKPAAIIAGCVAGECFFDSFFNVVCFVVVVVVCFVLFFCLPHDYHKTKASQHEPPTTNNFKDDG